MRNLSTKNGEKWLTNSADDHPKRGKGRLTRALKQVGQESPIASSRLAAPQTPKSLIKEIKKSPLLGNTASGKLIYLCNYQLDSAVIQELERLRKFRSAPLVNAPTCIPTLSNLVNHDGERCQPKGTDVLSVNIYPKFNHCIDRLMLVDLQHIRVKNSPDIVNHINRNRPQRESHG